MCLLIQNRKLINNNNNNYRKSACYIENVKFDIKSEYCGTFTEYSANFCKTNVIFQKLQLAGQTCLSYLTTFGLPLLPNGNII